MPKGLDNLDSMTISIIGSGALGKTYGGLLALAGHQVHFLARSEYAAIKETNYFRIYFKESEKTIQVDHPLIHDQPQDLPPSDLIIISLKTTENDKLESLLATCLKKESIILVIQNGIGNEEWISQFTGECPVICGVANIGAERTSAIDVKISFVGNVKLAPFKIENKHYCEAIEKAFRLAPVSLPITIHDNYKEIRWYKLAWNVPFGALSLIFDLPTYILATEEPYLTIVYRIIDEINTIAKAEGVVITDDHISQMIKVTQKSGHYFPSIYRDFKEGKLIEKHYLLDNILERAKKSNLIVPVLILIEKHLSSLLELRSNLARIKG